MQTIEFIRDLTAWANDRKEYLNQGKTLVQLADEFLTDHWAYKFRAIKVCIC